MKKIASIFTAVFILSFVFVGLSYAHCGVCGLRSAKDSDWLGKKMTMMTENLGLSDEQATQVEALIKEKVEKKKAVMDEYTAKIKALLTDEQNAKYDAMKAEKTKGSMKGSYHEHKGSKGSAGDDMKGSEKGS